MLAVSYFNSYYHYPQKNCQAHYSYGYVNCPEFFRAKIFSRIHYLEYFFFTLLLLTHCTMYLDLKTLLPIYIWPRRGQLLVTYYCWEKYNSFEKFIIQRNFHSTLPCLKYLNLWTILRIFLTSFDSVYIEYGPSHNFWIIEKKLCFAPYRMYP